MNTFRELSPFNISDDWASESQYLHSIFVFASGYESRSLALLERLLEHGDKERWTLCGFTFEKFCATGSRPYNDQFLASRDIECSVISALDSDSFIKAIRKKMENLRLLHESIRLVIDYSSMPRNWYCSLMLECMSEGWPVDVDWYYVGGEYSNLHYPCVGYGNFSRFSGSPNASSIEQTHIFGLGYDSIRTYGIWNYLDPQKSWCLISSLADDQTMRDTVRLKNSEIIGWSFGITEVIIESFPTILSSIGEIVRRSKALGDVALVPDGPKPLVLAMSIIPKLTGIDGVFCWHVGHVKPDGYLPLDIQSTGICYPFRLLTHK